MSRLIMNVTNSHFIKRKKQVISGLPLLECLSIVLKGPNLLVAKSLRKSRAYRVASIRRAISSKSFCVALCHPHRNPYNQTECRNMDKSPMIRRYRPTTEDRPTQEIHTLDTDVSLNDFP